MSTATLLPTKKTPASLSFERAKVLLYGQPKIGKTTLATNLADDVLILACEPGLGGLSAYSIEIDSWEKFRAVGAELSESDGKHSIVVIDTVDELYRLCADAVCQQLNIAHLADAEWGKGWQMARDEFRLRVGKLAGLRGVWFISHAAETDIRTRVGTRTRIVPTLDKRAFGFLEGMCDFIFFAEAMAGEKGDERVIRTAAAEEYIAGGRVNLPDPLPLDAAAVKKAIEGGTK